jgi:hypothetical protein
MANSTLMIIEFIIEFIIKFNIEFIIKFFMKVAYLLYMSSNILMYYIYIHIYYMYILFIIIGYMYILFIIKCYTYLLYVYTYLGADLAPIIREFINQKNTLVRGLAHPLIFQVYI